VSRQVWPGEPFPLGPRWDGEGTNFSLFSENATRVELCLFDGEHEERIEVHERTAFNWHCYLPGVGPGTRYGYRVQRAVRPRARPALQRVEAVDRSVREGDRRRRRLGRCERAPIPARDGHSRRGLDDRRVRLCARDPAVGRDRPGVRLGERRASQHAVAGDGDLRGAREGFHEEPRRGARGSPWHLRRPRGRGFDCPPQGSRCDRARAAPGAPHHRRGVPARARADELLGLLDDRLPRAALRILGDRDAGA